MRYEYDAENDMLITLDSNIKNFKRVIESLGVKTYKKEYKDTLYRCLNYEQDIERLTTYNKMLNKRLNKINNSKAYKVLRWFQRLFNYRVVLINLEEDNL